MIAQTVCRLGQWIYGLGLEYAQCVQGDRALVYQWVAWPFTARYRLALLK